MFTIKKLGEKIDEWGRGEDSKIAMGRFYVWEEGREEGSKRNDVGNYVGGWRVELGIQNERAKN